MKNIDFGDDFDDDKDEDAENVYPHIDHSLENVIDTELEVSEESSFSVKQDILRIFGTFAFFGNQMKSTNFTQKDLPAMKFLYDQLSKTLPLVHALCPASLESVKSNSRDCVLKDKDKQRNILKGSKSTTKIAKKNSLKKPTSAEKQKIEEKLLKKTSRKKRKV